MKKLVHKIVPCSGILEQLVYDSIPALRILHAPIKTKLPLGEAIVAEVRWIAVKDAFEAIYRNLRTHDYTLPLKPRLLPENIWIGLEPTDQNDTWLIKIVLIEENKDDPRS